MIAQHDSIPREKIYGDSLQLSKHRNWSWKSAFTWMIAAVWLWINVLTAMKYEAWRDVSQSWIIVRDLSLPELFAQLGYEGHPCLWYIFLLPFAKLGMPFEYISIVSMIPMAVAIVLFLRYAPFGLFQKGTIVFSSLCMYYLPVVARSYALVPLLLMLVYTLYPTRMVRPVRYACAVFLLCQVHILLCGIVGMLMFMWALEASISLYKKKDGVSLKKCVVSLAIMLISVLLLFVQVKGSVTNNQYVGINALESITDLRHLVFGTLSAGGNYVTGVEFYDYGNTVWWFILAPVFIAILALVILWLIRAPKSAIIFGVSFLWQAIIHIFIYSAHMHHILLLMWVLVFCVMLAMDELNGDQVHQRKKCDQLLSRMLVYGVVLLCVLGYNKTYREIQFEVHTQKYNSYSTYVAHVISEELPEDAIVICDAENFASCVAAYLPQGKCYNPTRKNDRIFFHQDGKPASWCSQDVLLDEPVQDLLLAGHSQEIYFLCSPDAEMNAMEMSERSTAKLEIMRSFVGNCKNEEFLLYRVVLP